MIIPAPTVPPINDAELISLIRATQHRLVCIAPGMSNKVAKALCEQWQRLGANAVNVILDVNPEVCRLGYGTMTALQALQSMATQLGTTVHHQPGIRTGIIITDDAMSVFAPVPLLIGASSHQPSQGSISDSSHIEPEMPSFSPAPGAPQFDEETYAKAKPHFQSALASFQEAGKSATDFIRFFIKHYGERIAPYLRRFNSELREEKANAESMGREPIREGTPPEDQEPGGGEAVRGGGNGTKMSAGLDPEVFSAGLKMAAYYIEGGARSFAEYAQYMIQDFGKAITPYLKLFYNAVRDYPGYESLAEGMDDTNEVQSIPQEDLEEFVDEVLSEATNEQPVGREDAREGTPPEDQEPGGGEAVRGGGNGPKMSAGVDPEFVRDGIDLSIFYIEGGLRSFKDYAEMMIFDLGRAVIPHLKSWYSAVRYIPELESLGIKDEMSSLVEVDAFPIDELNAIADDLESEENDEQPDEQPVEQEDIREGTPPEDQEPGGGGGTVREGGGREGTTDVLESPPSEGMSETEQNQPELTTGLHPNSPPSGRSGNNSENRVETAQSFGGAPDGASEDIVDEDRNRRGRGTQSEYETGGRMGVHISPEWETPEEEPSVEQQNAPESPAPPQMKTQETPPRQLQPPLWQEKTEASPSLAHPDTADTFETRVERLGTLFADGAATLNSMTRERKPLTFQAWADRLEKIYEGDSLFEDDTQKKWLWDALRTEPGCKKRFGDLPKPVPWTRDQHIQVFHAGEWFEIGFTVNMEKTTVLIQTKKPLNMRLGKGNRLECCDCEATITIQVREILSPQREADIMRIDPKQIDFPQNHILRVTVDSLNQAYTISSRRLEPNRRSHGGRAYDHIFHVAGTKRTPLEKIRRAVEDGTWKIPEPRNSNNQENS